MRVSAPGLGGMKRGFVRAFGLAFVGLLAPSFNGALHARSAPQELAWREAFQSSPAVTEFTTDERFNSFIQKLNLRPEIAEAIRPKHVTGTVRYRMSVVKTFGADRGVD